MTVSTTTSRVAYAGDGITVAFAVPFPFFNASDLTITERVIATGAETIKALGTHYTIAGGAGVTGTVTALAPPANTVQWIIVRALPFTQLIDYVSNDGFPAESHEAGLDRGAMRDQELRTALARTLRLPVTDPDGLIVELPAVPVRAGKVLGFDANGNLIVVVDVPAGSINLPLPIADGGTGATNAVAARTALAVAGLADANVFTADQVIEKTDGGGTEGPMLVVRRISASPALNDKIGGIAMDGKDGAGNTQRYAQVHAELVDPVHASEDSRLEFFTMVGGSYTSGMRLGGGLQIGFPSSGLDPGAGWINAQGGFKVNNVEIVGVLAGAIVQRVYAQTVAFSNNTAIIPFDDSIPQIGEGTEVLTAAITPKVTGNKLLVTVTLQVGGKSQDAVVAALFKDADAPALAAASMLGAWTDPGTGSLVINWEMPPPLGISAITFRVRMGPGTTGNAYLNGNDGARVLGGKVASSIVVSEVKV